jgi:hypothetical protein
MLYNAGISFRFVKSPLAPKITMAHGPGGGACRRGGAAITWAVCVVDGVSVMALVQMQEQHSIVAGGE